MVFCSTASEEPRGNCNLELKESREQGAIGCPGCNPRERSPTADCRGTVAKTSLHQAISGIGEVQVHRQMYRVPTCARIVRHTTADDNLNQKVQIAQDRTVEATPPETRTGERNPVPEAARKKVRFAERVEEQIPEGTVGTNSRSASSSSSSPSSSSSSTQTIALSMQIDESNEDRSERQNVTHGADMELEGLGMESERNRLQRYSDCDFLMQVKQNADIYFDRIFSNDHRKRETVKKELIQSGVHPPVDVAEVFSSPRLHLSSTDLVSHLDQTCHTVVVNLIVIGHSCKTWFFHCWSRFKRLQTANSSQRLPQPKYHCYNAVLSNMTPTIQLGEVTVCLFTIREERPPTVEM